jgi:alpha-galactosidase
MFRRKLYHHKSHEYGSYIIKGAYTNQPFPLNGSQLNKGYLVPNLPEYACVELPMTVDKDGFHSIPFKAIPEELAALNRTNINIQTMAIRAAHERKMEYVYMAVALDPHTSSEMTLDNIIKMCDEMYTEHHKGGWMPDYN